VDGFIHTHIHIHIHTRTVFNELLDRLDVRLEVVGRLLQALDDLLRGQDSGKAQGVQNLWCERGKAGLASRHIPLPSIHSYPLSTYRLHRLSVTPAASFAERLQLCKYGMLSG